MSAIENRIERFYTTVKDVFLRSRTQPFEAHLVVGSHPVTLIFANKNLVETFLPSFEHLISQEPAEDGFKVHIWDEVSSPFPMVAPPWEREEMDGVNLINSHSNDRFKAFFDPGAGTLALFDAKKNEAYYWVRNLSLIPSWDKAAPFRLLFHWWGLKRESLLAHAAAVGFEGKGALLVGKGGSGKSTTALSCLVHGGEFAGEDYCMVSMDGAPKAHALYGTAKIDPFSQKLLQGFLPSERHFRHTEKNKDIYYLHENYGKQLSATLPINCLLFPQVSHQNVPSFHPLSKREVFLAFAPSTVFQLRGLYSEGFQMASRFVNKVPCYKLKLTVNAQKNADAVQRFLCEENSMVGTWA